MLVLRTVYNVEIFLTLIDLVWQLTRGAYFVNNTGLMKNDGFGWLRIDRSKQID